MMMNRATSSRAFSLVEITLAIGIIGFAMLAIFGLIPVGMNAGRDAADATRTGLILQDVVNRVRATAVSNDASSPHYYGAYAAGTGSFFFYDSQGLRTGELLRVQFGNDQPAFYGNVTSPNDFYRVRVVVSAFDQAPSYPAYDPRQVTAGSRPNLLAATVEIGWPVNRQNGSVSGTNASRITHTFLLRRP